MIGTWPGEDRTESWTTQLKNDLHFQRSWLGAAMIAAGTWPMRILVVENTSQLQMPNGVQLASPYHLMEGHHRFGYLRALRDDHRWTPQAEHDIWLVRADLERVRDFWPLNLDLDV
jgi:hypothetical protein